MKFTGPLDFWLSGFLTLRLSGCLRYGIQAFGLSDFLGFWFDGSVTFGFPGLLVLWLSGFLVLRPSFLLSLRLPGLLAHLVFWFSSARVL